MCVMVVLSGSVLSWAQFLHSRLKAFSVAFFSFHAAVVILCHFNSQYISPNNGKHHIFDGSQLSWQITIKKCPDKFKLIFCAPLQWVRIENESSHSHTTQIIMEICGKVFSTPTICVWMIRLSDKLETWKWWKIYLNGKWIDLFWETFFFWFPFSSVILLIS